MIITSVTQKNVLSTVVIHYFAWYVFLRDRRYCYAKFPFNFVDKIISKSNRRPRWPLHCESGYFKLIYHVRIESIFFLSKTKKCPTLLNCWTISRWSLMPCPFTGPKMFCAGPNFLSQTKNLFTCCASHKHFVPEQMMICIQQNCFCVGTKFL